MWDDAADSPDPSVAEHVRRYLATDGRDGYLEGGVSNLVLTVKGRKSGRWLRTGLFFGEDDGRHILIASGYLDDGEHNLPALLRALEAGGLAIRSISLDRATLDDVFLRHTGRSLRDAA